MLKILLIEDDEMVLEIINKYFLGLKDIKLLAAKNLEQGLRLSKFVDAIITDIRLPDGSIEDVIDQFKVPVIAITAIPELNICERLGAKGVLVILKMNLVGPQFEIMIHGIIAHARAKKEKRLSVRDTSNFFLNKFKALRNPRYEYI